MTDRLERRYRWLLASYPTGHRAVYGEEMLGVLMTGSTPGQRRPGAGEAFNLVAFGLRTRLRAALPGTRTPAWRDALEAFGFLATVLTAALAVRPLAAYLALPAGLGDPPARDIAVGAAWTLAAVFAGLRLRWVAAGCATLAALVQAVVLAGWYVSEPGLLVVSWWRLVLAVAAAGSLVALLRPVPAPGPAGNPAPAGDPAIRRSPLGGRSRIAVAVAALLAAAAPAVEGPWSGTLEPGTVVYSSPSVDGWLLAPQPVRLPGFPVGDGRLSTVVTALALLVVLATVVLRLRPMVRRRVLTLATPAAVTALAVAETFNGFMVSTVRFDPPVYLVAPQWMVLAAAPVLTLMIGAWLVARHERRLASGTLLT